MIKEKIISNLEIYAETYNKATELWKNVRNQIMREYKEDFQADRLSSAKDVYEKTLADARNEIMSAVDDVLDSVRSKVISVTENEIPEAFESTLNIIKNFAIQYFDKVSFTDLYGNRIQCKLKKKYPRGTKAIQIDDICEMMLCIYNPSDEQIENLTK